ncbi:hypothetical protein FGB62_387g08 [Gracilaria domingensis]|nr:hypothetical protein FGB62_409g00 [Gracilaria domingensis]KAI0556849.1 hypothetical protein FGB62_387g08 [Gracilaria domingensis]
MSETSARQPNRLSIIHDPKTRARFPIAWIRVVQDDVVDVELLSAKVGRKKMTFSTFLDMVSVSREHGETILRYASLRVGRQFSYFDLERLGLINCSEGIEDVVDYQIKSILYSDKSTEKRECNSYYASGGSGSRYRGLWKIDFHTIQTHRTDVTFGVGRRLSQIMDNIRSVTEVESVFKIYDENGNAEAVTTERDAKAEAAFLDELDSYCVKHPNTVITLDSPGCRAPSRWAERYVLPQLGRIFCLSRGGSCLRASLVNAVNAMSGMEHAKRLLNMGRVFGATLNEVSNWLTYITGSYRLQNVQIPIADTVDVALSALGLGVFLVELEAEGENRETVRHCVVVNGHRRHVIDPEQMYPLRMRRGRFKTCVGDGFTLIHCTVKELTTQVWGKRRRNRRPTKRRKTMRYGETTSRRRQTKKFVACSDSE